MFVPMLFDGRDMFVGFVVPGRKRSDGHSHRGVSRPTHKVPMFVMNLWPPDLAWNRETVERFWRWQNCYNRKNYLCEQVGGEIAKVVRRWIRRDEWILDWGSGTEALADHLGLRNPFFCYEPGSYLPSGPFGGATLIDVIEHLDREEGSRSLAKIYENLKPAGVLIVTTGNEEDIGPRVYCPGCDRQFHPMQHIRTFTKAALAQDVIDAGFKVITLYATTWWVQKSWRPWVKVRALFRKPENLVCVARKP